MLKTPTARRRKKKANPLNLVSVLDMVFILNFFLLSSAQFIKIYEIGSDLPIYKLSPDEKNEKQLDLRVSVSDDKMITLSNDAKKETFSTFSMEDMDSIKQMQELLISLKDKFPDESRVVISSAAKVSYQELVSVLDIIRESREAGEVVKLFNEIVFDNQL